MQAASWQLQERLQEQVDKLTEERDEMARRLAQAEDNATAAGGTDAAIQDQLDSLRRYGCGEWLLDCRASWPIGTLCSAVYGTATSRGSRGVGPLPVVQADTGRN